MPTPKEHIPLRGSERAFLPGSRAVGPANPDERLEVTVLLRPPAETKEFSAADLGTRLPQERQHLTRDQFEATHGASEEDVAKIEAFAHEHRLAVVQVDPARRTVVLSGTVASFCAAFDVELLRYEHPEGAYRGRTGPVHIPAELADTVVGVLGLDNRPQARAHFRTRGSAATVRGLAAGTSYNPTQIASLYNFPSNADGKGQCIALIELDGGYRPRDIKTYFKQINLPVPRVTAVSVDGGQNHPTGNPDGPDGEVMLDIEVAGGVAPGASIVVYFAPNTDRGFLDAITTAIHDKRRNPSVISISWGNPEANWTAQALQAFDQAFQDAAAVGVTVCCAAGDNGSTDGLTDGLQHADFPASSPHVLACGGTRLESSGNQITAETVWNEGPGNGASGGGVSDVFPIPPWETGAGVPPTANPSHFKGRGLPDVAGDADPATGYSVIVDGQAGVIGGTSAVAPLWAGLIARVNQLLGQPVGYLTPLLYTKFANTGALHDITKGDIGAYQAGPGWDACTGWGTPDGTQLAAALSGKPAAKAARP